MELTPTVLSLDGPARTLSGSPRTKRQRAIAYCKANPRAAAKFAAASTSPRPAPSAAASSGILPSPCTAKQLDAAFAHVDVRGNAALSLAELVKAAQYLCPGFADTQALMAAYKACDADGSGYIGRKEFGRLFARRVPPRVRLRPVCQRCGTSLTAPLRAYHAVLPGLLRPGDLGDDVTEKRATARNNGFTTASKVPRRKHCCRDA